MNDLLTVKEFAAAAGVSTQRIYKAMKTTLQPYVANTENGLIMLKSDGLREFGLQHCNPMLQAESCKAQSSSNTGIDGDLSPELATQGLQPRVASDTDRLIDTQAAEIETLKAELDRLHAQFENMLQQHAAEISAKDKQIGELHEMLYYHMREQALNARQQQQLTDQGDQGRGASDTPEPSFSSSTEKENEPEGSSSTAITKEKEITQAPESTPKRGLFAHIRAAWSKVTGNPPEG